MPDINNINPLDENAILREVWSVNDIKAKTELSDQQIESVNKLISMSEIFGNKFLASNVNSFLVLQKSRNRQSMKEFVDVVRNKFEDSIAKNGMMSKMFG